MERFEDGSEAHETSRPGTGSDLLLETAIDIALEQGIITTGDPDVDFVTAGVQWTKQHLANLDTHNNNPSSNDQDGPV